MSGARKLTFAKRGAPAKASTAAQAAVEMERRVVFIRWLAIAVASGALPFLRLGSGTIPLMGLIVLTAAYNLALQLFVPRGPRWLNPGYVSSVGDVLICTAGVAVSGGITSPFSLAYFLVVAMVAVRFGGLATIMAVSTTTVSYLAVVYFVNFRNGGLADPVTAFTNVVIQMGFVGMTGFFSAFLGDRARKAEQALQEELERAHASLSQVTAELNRDLDFEQTCQLAAQKGRALLDADVVLLQVQMPSLLDADDPVATPKLFIDWTPDLVQAHARTDLSGARLNLNPVSSEQLIPVADPNVFMTVEHQPLPGGVWVRVPVFHGARAIADLLMGFVGRAEPLRDTEQELLLTFAERAGIAMRNAHTLDPVSYTHLTLPTKA